MRILVFLAVIINLLVGAYGQGFFGVAPADLGRSPSPKPFFNHADIQINSIDS